MSDQDTKNKNSKRRHDDETKVKKQAKIAKEHGAPVKEAHRLHKKHAMDCGNPECFLCGNPRYSGGKDKLTAQEKRLFQDVEQLRDRHSNGTLPKDEE